MLPYEDILKGVPLECPCGCGTKVDQPYMIRKLANLHAFLPNQTSIVRTVVCDNIFINEPERFLKQHQLCFAVDVHHTLSTERYELIKLGQLLGFNEIFLHRTFIHLGMFSREKPGSLFINW